ncbi:MAG: hypothetical protein ACKOUM_08320 [Sphingopyxis sp.]
MSLYQIQGAAQPSAAQPSAPRIAVPCRAAQGGIGAHYAASARISVDMRKLQLLPRRCAVKGQGGAR